MNRFIHMLAYRVLESYVPSRNCVLQCVAVCCNVLQCVAVCCSAYRVLESYVPSGNCVLQYVAECCSVVQCVAVCCNVLQCVAVHINEWRPTYIATHERGTDKTLLRMHSEKKPFSLFPECILFNTYSRTLFRVNRIGFFSERSRLFPVQKGLF